jgi:hypothetical protein
MAHLLSFNPQDTNRLNKLETFTQGQFFIALIQAACLLQNPPQKLASILSKTSNELLLTHPFIRKMIYILLQD